MPVKEIRGLVEAQRKIEQVAGDLHGRKMLEAMQRAALLVTADAKLLAPVDSGRLRASITPEIRLDGNDVMGVVGSAVTYAAAVELGSRPHWVPISALERWARRKGVNVYAVQMAIAKKGTKAKNFMRDAYEGNLSEIQTMFETVVMEIVAE